MLRQNEHHARPEISVIWRNTGTIGACQHLRLTAPFTWLERYQGWAPLDYAIERGIPDPKQIRRLSLADRLTRGRASRTIWGRAVQAGVREEMTIRPARHARALLVYREGLPEFIDEAYRVARQRRIPLVYDTDDLLLAVPHESPLREHYIAMRPHLLRWIHQADHVTVANSMLAAEFAEHHRSVSILPSFIDRDLWGVSEIPPPDDGPVSVGFWGTATHAPDLQRLTASFRHLKARYGRRVRFQFLGCCDAELMSLEDVAVGGYVSSYADYAFATHGCRLDIAIAPLAINRFNRCKSPIKFFEYSIRGACGIYADLEPYQAVVRQHENGYLVGEDPDEWVGALEQLIDNPSLRHRLACRAQADVLAHHTLNHHAWRWRDVYEPMLQSGRDVPNFAVSLRRAPARGA